MKSILRLQHFQPKFLQDFWGKILHFVSLCLHVISYFDGNWLFSCFLGWNWNLYFLCIDPRFGNSGCSFEIILELNLVKYIYFISGFWKNHHIFVLSQRFFDFVSFISFHKRNASWRFKINHGAQTFFS